MSIEKSVNIGSLEYELLIKGHALEKTSVAIGFTDSSGKIMYANEAFLKMWKFESIDNVIGHSPQDFFVNQELIKEKLKASMDNNVVVYEAEAMRNDGTTFLVNVTASSLKSENGEFIGHFASMADVTERKLKEERMIHAGRLTSLAEMAGGLSHEMNQPLTGIRTVAQGVLIGLERGWDYEIDEIKEKFKMIIEQSDRMSSIITHMREFAGLDKVLEKEEVNIVSIIDDVFKFIGQQLRKHDINITKKYDTDLPQINIYRTQIQQVFVNLIANARDSLDEKGVVCANDGKEFDKNIIITVTKDHIDEVENIIIKIKDNGLGIPQENIDKIFDPFFTTKPSDKASGLGLSISYGIIRDHFGSLIFDATENEGASFIINLPIGK
ncbi:MAG: PAS domain-containing protein [Candidatus Aureabacteria bacterium]|nr:PAS domain-containing protein [Candidatus Auribacterota bacterium]